MDCNIRGLLQIFLSEDMEQHTFYLELHIDEVDYEEILLHGYESKEAVTIGCRHLHQLLATAEYEYHELVAFRITVVTFL